MIPIKPCWNSRTDAPITWPNVCFLKTKSSQCTTYGAILLSQTNTAKEFGGHELSSAVMLRLSVADLASLCPKKSYKKKWGKVWDISVKDIFTLRDFKIIACHDVWNPNQILTELYNRLYEKDPLAIDLWWFLSSSIPKNTNILQCELDVVRWSFLSI